MYDQFRKYWVPAHITKSKGGKKVRLAKWRNNETYPNVAFTNWNAKAIRTGAKTFCVIDIDTDDLDTLEEPFKSWAKSCLSGEKGTIVKTRRGYHFYVAPTPELQTTTPTDRNALPEHVDIRGRGGLVFFECSNTDVASYELIASDGWCPMEEIIDLLPLAPVDGDESTEPNPEEPDALDMAMKEDRISTEEVEWLYRQLPTSSDYNTWLSYGFMLYARFNGSEEGRKIWAAYVTRCYLESPDNAWSGVEHDIGKWDRGELRPNRKTDFGLMELFDRHKTEEFIGRIEKAATSEEIEEIEEEIRYAPFKMHRDIEENLKRIAEPLTHKRKELGMDSYKRQARSYWKELYPPEAFSSQARDSDSYLGNRIVLVDDVRGTQKYFDLKGRSYYSDEALTTRFQEEIKEEVKSNPPKTFTAPYTFKKVFGRAIRVCTTTEYRPDIEEQVFFDHDRDTYILNTYTGRPSPAKEYTPQGKYHIDYFVDHILRILGKREGHILLDYIAYALQNFGTKMAWAPLIQSEQGIGKTVLGDIFKALFGTQNTTTVDSRVLLQAQTGWVVDKVFCVLEEIKVAGHNRYEIMNALKPLITNKRISLVEKYVVTREVNNYANFIAFTNYKDALPVDDGDRRWWIVYSVVSSKEGLLQLTGVDTLYNYFKPLYDLAKSPDMIRQLLRYFMDRPVVFSTDGEGFHPNFLPRSEYNTYAQGTEIATNVWGGEQFLSALEANFPGITKEVISSRQLAEYIQMEGVKLRSRDVAHLLKKFNYVKAPTRARYKGEQHYIWIKDTSMSVIEARNIFLASMENGAVDSFDDLDDDDLFN